MTRLSELLHARNPEGLSAREVGRRVEAAGYSMSQGTVTALFGGRHHRRPDDSTLEGLTKVLPVTMAELREAIEIPVEPGDPWEPPEAARYLTLEQREALTQLIFSMVPDHKLAVGRRTSSTRSPSGYTSLDPS